MLSTPPPIPISICLALISLAILITAWRPEEHYLLTLLRVAVSGIPAINYAILEVVAPDPGYNTLPIQIS